MLEGDYSGDTRMTFEGYWVEIEKLKVLPQKAIQQLPSSLSLETKKRLMMLRPEDTAEKLKAVIDEVNRGSIESIDRLIKKRL